jgi:tetratricopeptide (TPR) repeat protein
MTTAMAAYQRPLAQSAAAQQDFQSLVLSCNRDGMDSLRKGQLKAAFEQFKYAEAVLIANQTEGDSTSLLAVTCNNLGCYYKKTGKLHGALSYLRRALRMEIDLDTDEVTLAGTHLNICAILSKLEKHDKAVQHAQSALELINQRVDSADPQSVSHDEYSVLAIAYHNVAVERDFLHEYEQAATAFREGYQVAKRCLGEDHPLSITLSKNCDAVLQKSQKLANLPSSAAVASSRALMKDMDIPLRPQERGGLVSLPPIAKATGGGEGDAMPAAGDTLPMPHGVRQEAANWVQSEATAWSSFASKTLGKEVPEDRLEPSFR